MLKNKLSIASEIFNRAAIKEGPVFEHQIEWCTPMEQGDDWFDAIIDELVDKLEDLLSSVFFNNLST